MRNFAHDTAAKQQNADHEGQAHENGDHGAQVGQVVLHGHDDRGAEHRAKQSPHAAEQGHEHHFARHLPAHIGECGQAKSNRFGRAGQACERAREHKGQQLVAVDVVAQ